MCAPSALRGTPLIRSQILGSPGFGRAAGASLGNCYFCYFCYWGVLWFTMAQGRPTMETVISVIFVIWVLGGRKGPQITKITEITVSWVSLACAPSALRGTPPDTFSDPRFSSPGFGRVWGGQPGANPENCYFCYFCYLGVGGEGKAPK